MKSKLSLAAFVAALMMSLGAVNAAAQVADPFGVSADNVMPNREIAVNASTKYINVSQGEVVKFVSQQQSFTWKFDTFGRQPFALSEIAPKGFDGANAMIYLSTNPLYRGH
jgi:hypothetical protein